MSEGIDRQRYHALAVIIAQTYGVTPTPDVLKLATEQIVRAVASDPVFGRTSVPAQLGRVADALEDLSATAKLSHGLQTLQLVPRDVSLQSYQKMSVIASGGGES